jgi:alanyl-tRNA synthetase
MRNHSATHLLHEALRETLGDHVNQSGSLVAPDRLRFDFTHFAALDPVDLEQVERKVNARIRDNLQVESFHESLEKAKAMGAAALFGEKYGDTVRVLRMGDYSLELCGGTHVVATGEIGQFMVLSEGGVAAGIRRIEALTGEAAEERSLEERRMLRQVAGLLNVPATEVLARVDQLVEHTKQTEKALASMRREVAGSQIDALVRNAATVDGMRVVAASIDVADVKGFRSAADALRNRLGSGVGVLGAVFENKVSLLAVVTDDLISTKGLKAGDIVQQVAREVGGSGGGKPHMAQAGGKDPAKLPGALSKVPEIVRSLLQ